MSTILASEIPREVARTAARLEENGFEAYLVGGCVRDVLLNIQPKDWDITTNATPEAIVALFENTYQNNDFGTVGVVHEDATDDTVHVVEVTPYRIEAGYSDARRPDSVSWSAHIADDLKRRDFTVNAIAYRPHTEEFLDLFGGLEDLKHKRLKAVGDPGERFSEDALRMMRAVRLAVSLGFTIEADTMAAVAAQSSHLSRISKERIRDEFMRIIQSPEPMQGIILLEKLGMLSYVVPELLNARGVSQNKTHAFDVYEHLLRTLQHAADKNWSLEIRLAALFHDISKPESRRFSEEKKDWTFHGHEVLGARVTKKALQNLKFPKDIIEKVTALVRWHMFFSDPDQVTLSAVRRTIRNVGEENIWDLLNVRICDRIGTGRPKEQPFRLRKYIAMVEEALRDPISVKMLKIDGTRIMEITGNAPGPKLGHTLHALLEEVLEDPRKNTAENLEKRAIELMKLPDNELILLGEKGREKQREEEQTALKDILKKHHVS